MIEEQLKITEAWEYFRNKTGVPIERRTFFSWIEDGHVKINELTIDLRANQINTIYFIGRSKIDALIQALKP